MAIILQAVPYFERPTTVTVRGRSIPVKEHQIVVWLSVAEFRTAEFHPQTPRWPAILDTGCNHNLLLNERHLIAWAGIHPDHLPKLASIRVSGQRVSQLGANLWLHPNIPGERDQSRSEPPFRLELVPGIAVYPVRPDEPLYPRLPLLGLRAFRRLGLQLAIDCHHCRLTVRTRRRLWWLAGS